MSNKPSKNRRNTKPLKSGQPNNKIRFPLKFGWLLDGEGCLDDTLYLKYTSL